jgi:hypothetical protein
MRRYVNLMYYATCIIVWNQEFYDYISTHTVDIGNIVRGTIKNEILKFDLEQYIFLSLSG